MGICDAVPGVAQRAKESLDFEFATENPDDIFGNPEIDVVDVCTPNVYHKDQVLKALSAGKNVYCDKPLATSYEETKEITSVLSKYNAVSQMALQYRFFPATMRAKELIEEGRIGRVLSFRACYLHSGSVDAKKAIGSKQDKKFGGGGVLFDLGSHVIDVMYFLLGKYDSVFTTTDIIYKQRPDKSGSMIDITADDAAYMLVKMKNGCTGTIEASKIATGTNDELRFEIHGDKGAIRFNNMDPNWLDFYDNTVPEEPLGGTKGFTRIECVQRFKKPGGDFPASKFSIGWIRSHVHSLYSFLSCVDEGRQASPSFEDGAYVQHVMEKAYEADERKSWVSID
jgi:predicted dehydrogenase